MNHSPARQCNSSGRTISMSAAASLPGCLVEARWRGGYAGVGRDRRRHQRSPARRGDRSRGDSGLRFDRRLAPRRTRGGRAGHSRCGDAAPVRSTAPNSRRSRRAIWPRASGASSRPQGVCAASTADGALLVDSDAGWTQVVRAGSLVLQQSRRSRDPRLRRRQHRADDRSVQRSRAARALARDDRRRANARRIRRAASLAARERRVFARRRATAWRSGRSCRA